MRFAERDGFLDQLAPCSSPEVVLAGPAAALKKIANVLKVLLNLVV
jgi:hypothetical protein